MERTEWHVRRLGIVVVVALVAHVWMLPATGAPTVPSAMGHAHAPTAAPSAVPDPGHCPFGMAACVVQLPPETGDDLLRAMLLATAVIPLAARRRAARTTRPSPRPPPRSRGPRSPRRWSSWSDPAPDGPAVGDHPHQARQEDPMRTTAHRHPVALLPIAVALALVLAGCGSDDDTTDAPTDTAEAAGDTGTTDMEDMDETFTFGEPADAADADRTVEIEATDELAFDPATISVAAGEVVAFEVHNVGQADHEFVLGPADVQDEHEMEMADSGEEAMEHAEANAIEVPAGETATLTWRFSEAGEVLYGCHEPGHYGAGMVGTITVE